MTEAQTAAQPPAAAKRSYIRPVTIFTVPVDRDTIFSNDKGKYKSRVENRQRRLIIKSTFIKSFLRYDEYIRLITTGYSPVPAIEKDLTGPAFLYFKRALLLFTDRRILHIPTRFNRSPRGAVSQIMYEDCAGLEMKGRALEVLYKNGQREVFDCIGLKERKKLRLLMADICLSPESNGEPAGRVHLCPRCGGRLPQGEMRCVSCNLAFTSRLKAGLWALLVPGGAFFYLRYPLAGPLVALFEIALIAFTVSIWMEISRGLSAGYGLAVFATCALAIEKWLSCYYAGQLVQDFVPEEKDVRFAKPKRQADLVTSNEN
jgi:hypothetical protein